MLSLRLRPAPSRPKAYMRAFLRPVLIVIAMAVAGILPAAQPLQQQPPPPPTPERDPAQQPIRTGINFVRVDVIVTDNKGNPVLDLTQEDFQLAEDGKPQTIQTFSVVKIDEATQFETRPSEIRSKADEEREAARPDVRLFIILFDDYHVRRGNDMAVRKPLIDFVQNQLAPQDMVAIMYPLTPVSALTFTRNKSSMIAAINTFEGRKGIYQPRNEFEERYAYYPTAT